MDNETEMIRQDMEDTRNSLQDKLETLEQQVKDTVLDATETVQSVTDAVQETVETVKDTVQETVQSVKQSLDMSQHYQAHPWVFVAGVAAVGFVGARLLAGATAPYPVASTPPAGAAGVFAVSPGRGNGAKVAPPPSQPSIWQKISDHYGEEIKKLQGLAVGTAAAVVREMITSAAAPAVAEQLSELVDSVTVKLGGQPIHGPVFTGTPASEADKPANYRDATNTGRSTEPAQGVASSAGEGAANRVFNTQRDA